MDFHNTFNTISVKEAIKAAGLDFEVSKSQILVCDLDKVESDHVSTYILATGEILGVVGKDFGIVDNAEAFSFGEFLDKAEWYEGGRTSAGLNYLSARFPSVKVNGENYRPRMTIQNGFNGRWKLVASFALVNEINGNTIDIPCGEGSMTIRHSRLISDRITMAKQAMRSVDAYVRNFTTEAEGLGKLPITDAALELVVSDLFPITNKTTATAAKHQMDKREAFLAAYRDPENDNWRGTAWGVVRAYSGFLRAKNDKKAMKGGRKAERAIESNLVSGKNYHKVIDVLKENY